MYTRDVMAYVGFCGYEGPRALQAATLRRWRTYLVQDTALSPHTINRMLAAVKRVVQEGGVQGLVEPAEAAAFRQVEGVSVEALRHRLKAHARVRITPAQMRSRWRPWRRGSCWRWRATCARGWCPVRRRRRQRWRSGLYG
jgi:hypothetical protein